MKFIWFDEQYLKKNLFLKSFEDISLLIGDSVVTNKDVQYLMIEKFLLIRILNKVFKIGKMLNQI